MPSKKLLVPAIFVGLLAFLAAIYFIWGYQKALCFRKSGTEFKRTGKVQETLQEKKYPPLNEFSENSGMSQE